MAANLKVGFIDPAPDHCTSLADRRRSAARLRPLFRGGLFHFSFLLQIARTEAQGGCIKVKSTGG
jgi:hypothetical protein